MFSKRVQFLGQLHLNLHVGSRWHILKTTLCISFFGMQLQACWRKHPVYHYMIRDVPRELMFKSGTCVPGMSINSTKSTEHSHVAHVHGTSFLHHCTIKNIPTQPIGKYQGNLLCIDAMGMYQDHMSEGWSTPSIGDKLIQPLIGNPYT